MKVVIPIKYYTSTQNELLDLGVKISEEECIDRDCIFYNINMIVEDHLSNGTVIHANGDTYVSPLKVEQIEKLIDNANK